jgi:hypothetical protein
VEDAVQAVRPLGGRGTWAPIEAALQSDADAAGELDWNSDADSTIVRVISMPRVPVKGAERR